MDDMRQRILIQVLPELAERVSMPENAPQSFAAHAMHVLVKLRSKVWIEFGFSDGLRTPLATRSLRIKAKKRARSASRSANASADGTIGGMRLNEC